MKTFAASLVLGLFALTATAHAQTGEIGGNTIGTYLASIVDFINVYLVPFLFAIAFIAFIWGVFTYFIAGGANEEQRDKGKQLVLWGVIGFVVMVSVWGLVNLVTNTLGFKDTNMDKTPDLPTFDIKKAN